GSAVALDRQTGRVAKRVDLGDVSPGYAVAGGGAVWITNFGGTSVTRVDPRSGRVLGTTTLGTHPLGIAFGYGSAWITNLDGASVSRVDARSGRVLATVPVPGGELQGVAVGLGRVWVASVASDTIWEVDP